MRKINGIVIKDRFKDIRKKHNYTQEYVAEKLDVGTRYISDLERGIALGGISTLIKLCNLYKVTPTYFLQDYLDVQKDIKLASELYEFDKLNKKEKKLIIDMIHLLNTREEHI